jgi:hypothetical protein
VCAIQDGAEWIQGFVQGHRHDARRILDFAHAASYVCEIAALVRQGGGHLPAKWEEGVLHRLKHEGPARVLRHLDRLVLRYPQTAEQVNYLSKRRELMEYPTYQHQGWPIGSGSVESSHKFVVQARLKGAGMHWKPVNPMLALLNERWSESWQLQERLRLRQGQLKRRLVNSSGGVSRPHNSRGSRPSCRWPHPLSRCARRRGAPRRSIHHRRNGASSPA